MAEGLVFALMGVIIGTFIPFIAGWVTFDRSLHEMIAETQALRAEAQELRRLSVSLASELTKRDETASSVASDTSTRGAGALEDSISSFAIGRELGGPSADRTRVTAVR